MANSFYDWLDTLFMWGVRPIEILVQIALSLRAVTCNLHKYFCPAELLHIVKENMDYYIDKHFFDENGVMDITPCPNINTDIMIAHGYKTVDEKQLLEQNVIVLPVDYFCPLNFYSHKLNKTQNTYAIHWYGASWFSRDEQTRYKLRNIKIKTMNFLHISKK